MAEAGKETPPPSGSFWDGLLKNQYQQLKALELATMGKVSKSNSNADRVASCGSLTLEAAPCLLLVRAEIAFFTESWCGVSVENSLHALAQQHQKRLRRGGSDQLPLTTQLRDAEQLWDVRAVRRASAIARR